MLAAGWLASSAHAKEAPAPDSRTPMPGGQAARESGLVIHDGKGTTSCRCAGSDDTKDNGILFYATVRRSTG